MVMISSMLIRCRMVSGMCVIVKLVVIISIVVIRGVNV